MREAGDDSGSDYGGEEEPPWRGIDLEEPEEPESRSPLLSHNFSSSFRLDSPAFVLSSNGVMGGQARKGSATSADAVPLASPLARRPSQARPGQDEELEEITRQPPRSASALSVRPSQVGLAVDYMAGQSIRESHSSLPSPGQRDADPSLPHSTPSTQPIPLLPPPPCLLRSSRAHLFPPPVRPALAPVPDQARAHLNLARVPDSPVLHPHSRSSRLSDVPQLVRWSSRHARFARHWSLTLARRLTRARRPDPASASTAPSVVQGVRHLQPEPRRPARSRQELQLRQVWFECRQGQVAVSSATHGPEQLCDQDGGPAATPDRERESARSQPAD